MTADLTARAESYAARIDSLGSRRFFFLLFVPLLVVFFATSSRERPFSIDAHTNTLTAWKLGTEGTVYIDENLDVVGEPYFGALIWLLDSDGHAVSKYPPGAALFAAPFYAVAGSEGHLESVVVQGKDGAPLPADIVLPSAVPAALAASVAVAAAVAVMGLVLRNLMSGRYAALGAIVLGLGTAAWSVAADALWQHGPAMLALALALWLVSRNHFLASGLLFGFAILTRPQLAVVAAVIGITIGLIERAWRPVVLVGLGSAAGLAAYMAFNQVLFDSWTPPTQAGGYFVDALGSGSDWWRDLKDIWLAMFDLERGLFVFSPFLLFLLPGVRRGWKSAAPWVKGAALGGVLYLLVQLRGNVFSGGEAFFGYRYPIEMIVVATPLLALGFAKWAAGHPMRVRLVVWSATLSIAIHSYGAISG